MHSVSNEYFMTNFPDFVDESLSSMNSLISQLNAIALKARISKANMFCTACTQC